MNGRKIAKGIYTGAAALILTIVMIVSLCACGGGAEASAAVSEPAVQQEAVSAGEADQQETAGAEDSGEALLQASTSGTSGTQAGNAGGKTSSQQTGSASSSPASSGTASGTSAAQGTASASSNPAFRDAVFNAAAAQGNAEASVDISSVSLGYAAIHCDTTAKLKFQVLKDDATYTYSVVNGEDQIIPLQMGDGHYLFRVMKNIKDNKYTELYRCEADVKITDPMDPFLRPNLYAGYTQESECIKLASKLAQSAGSEEDYIREVYQYVVNNITYDRELASTVQSGYLPDPDRTLTTGKGICLDYACLAASMLRSQGVPTKIIFGYVAPDDIYHAWNKFYSEKGGWQLVEFTVSAKDWTRIDLTFSAASAAASEFIGDGTNYMEAYEY